jgi:hypothetical protein
MKIFAFNVAIDSSEGQFLEEQQFLCEADDLMGAYMRADEVAREIAEKINAKQGKLIVSVSLVSNADVFWADEAGLDEYVKKVRYCHCEDDE